MCLIKFVVCAIEIKCDKKNVFETNITKKKTKDD